MEWGCSTPFSLKVFPFQLANVLGKAFQICESLSFATILVTKLFCLVTRMGWNTASESAVLHPPPLVAREQSGRILNGTMH